MTSLRTCGTRQNAVWGKNVGGRTRTVAVMLTVCAGLVLASAPTASAKKPLPPPPPVASIPTAPNTSTADASWVDLAYEG